MGAVPFCMKLSWQQRPCHTMQEWRPVQLSTVEKAAQASLSNANLTVTMRKGYRMVCHPSAVHALLAPCRLTVSEH